MNKSINLKQILQIAAIVLLSIMNLTYLYDEIMAYFICAIEVLILVLLWATDDMSAYFGCYLIFLCLSFEFSQYVQEREIFNFKNIKFFNINLSLWLQIPLYFKFLFSKRRKIDSRFKNGILIFVALQLISVIMGLITVFAVNDNNISSISDVFILFFQEFAFYCYFIDGIIVGCILSLTEKNGLKKLKRYFYFIIFGVCVQTIFSLLFKYYAWYGQIPILLVSNISFIFPLFLLLPLYDKNDFPIALIPLLVITNFMLIMYNANGKLYLYLFIVVFIYFMRIVFLTARNKKYLPVLVILIVACLFVSLIYLNIRDDFVISYKLDQVFQLLNVFDSDWLKNMSDSPKTRIVEFMCIWHELLCKPYYLLFGKGILGSITDSMGFFFGKENRGLFSLGEFAAGAYYGVHESFNIVFLQNGLIGLCLLVYLTVAGLFKKGKNVYMMIGSIWLVSNYGYSNCITAIGVSFLIIGWYVYCNKTNKLKGIHAKQRYFNAHS